MPNIDNIDNGKITGTDELISYSAEDLSVLPKDAADNFVSTPTEVKKYINPAGIKQLNSLIREIFLLKVDKMVDQAWTDSIYYTTEVENFGNTFLADIKPKMEKLNPLPDSVINHMQFLIDANAHYHIDATTPKGESHLRSNSLDEIHFKIETVDLENPLLTGSYHINEMTTHDGQYFEGTYDMRNHVPNPDMVTGATYNLEDRTYLVPSDIDQTQVKNGKYIDIGVYTIDHHARILFDSQQGRIFIFHNDPLKYINELTVRLQLDNITPNPPPRPPETVARLIDIPVHTKDLENIVNCIPFTGTKEKDDQYFPTSWRLPYTQGYTGVMNRETYPRDDLYTTKNDFNFLWNQLNNKLLYIDYDRNNHWTATNRLRNTGNYLGMIYRYTGLDGNTGTLPPHIPDEGWTTTWGHLRRVLSCDDKRAAYDNDWFIVQKNDDDGKYTFQQNYYVGAEYPNVDIRINFQTSMWEGNVYIQTTTFDTLDNDLNMNNVNQNALTNYVNFFFFNNKGIPVNTLTQNTIDNRIYQYNGGYAWTCISKVIPNTIPEENIRSMQPDSYTYRPCIYYIINNDVDKDNNLLQYQKTGNEGLPADSSVTVFHSPIPPDVPTTEMQKAHAWLDNRLRDFANPNMPLGRGRIDTLEIEDRAVTLEKMDKWVQNYFQTDLMKLLVYYSDNARDPQVATGCLPYDYRQQYPRHREHGYNVAFNAYTRVLWILTTDYSPTERNLIDPEVNHLCCTGATATGQKWLPVAGTIFP
jgi:hypothetical protein